MTNATTRILLLFVGLILPFIAFVLYFASKPLPVWFPYAAACYFFACIFVFPTLKKRVLAGVPAPTPEEQKAQNISGARALRRLGYIWLIGPVFYVLSGGPIRNPWWATVLGLSWAGFLSWISFHEAKKLDVKARQQTAV